VRVCWEPRIACSHDQMGMSTAILNSYPHSFGGLCSAAALASAWLQGPGADSAGRKITNLEQRSAEKPADLEAERSAAVALERSSA
jgi:hypothetical protein